MITVMLTTASIVVNRIRRTSRPKIAHAPSRSRITEIDSRGSSSRPLSCRYISRSRMNRPRRSEDTSSRSGGSISSTAGSAIRSAGTSPRSARARMRKTSNRVSAPSTNSAITKAMRIGSNEVVKAREAAAMATKEAKAIAMFRAFIGRT